MNKYFILPILILTISILGCNKEHFATLEVVNQTSCIQNLYNGSSSITGGSYMGAIGANQTKEFEISLGSADNGYESYYNDPQNCGSAIPKQFLNIEFEKDKTTTILID